MSIRQANELLRDEMAAVSAYTSAILRFSGDVEAPTLRSILEDHIDSAEQLHEQIVRLGGRPADEAGAWGGFVRAVEGASSLLGDGAAVEALKNGEKHGVHHYKEAICSEHTDEDSRLLYTELLAPRLLTHLTLLEVLVGGDDHAK